MTCGSQEWYEWLFREDKRSKKLKTDKELLSYYCEELKKTHEHWQDEYENGCSDPFWCDGTNLNLVRNHIMHYIDNIIMLCKSHNLSFPAILEKPVPKKVPDNYMAKRRKCFNSGAEKWFAEHETKSDSNNEEKYVIEEGTEQLSFAF